MRRSIKLTDRFLAAVLSFVMIIAMIPVTSLQTSAATTEHPDAYTATVKDGEGAAVEGATVTLSAVLTAETNLELTAATDATGTAAFDQTAIAAALTGATLETAAATLTVVKEGYDQNQTTATISATETYHHDITLTKTVTAPQETVTVTVVATGEGTVAVNNAVVTDSVTVEKGLVTDVAVAAADGYFIKTLTIGDAAQTIADKYNLVVEDVTLSADCQISVTFVKEHIVTVSKLGEGTFSVNGTEVTDSIKVVDGENNVLSVAAAEGYFIKELIIGGEPKTITDKYEMTVSEVVFAKSTDVAVTFAKEYTVTVKKTGDGTVMLNGEEVDKLIVEVGTQITIAAEAAENFIVGDICVNDVKTTKDSFSVAENTVISVNFLRTFTVEVNYDENTQMAKINGQESVTEDLGRVTATVVNGNEVAVTVTPNSGYRLAKVTFDGEEVTFEKVNDKAYEHSWFVAEDVTIAVSFEPNEYTVSSTVSPVDTVSPRATVSVNKLDITGKTTTVYHGETVEIVVKLSKGEELTGFKVNDDTITEDLVVVSDDGSQWTYYVIPTGDMNVMVTTEAIEDDDDTLFEKLSFSNDKNVSSSDGYYFYQADAQVTISASDEDILGVAINEDFAKRKTEDTWTTKEDTHIESIHLRMKNERGYARWVPVILPDNGIYIVIDDDAPVVTISKDAPTIFNDGDVISFDVTDNGANNDPNNDIDDEKGSGIKTVSCTFTYKDGTNAENVSAVLKDSKWEVKVPVPVSYSDEVQVTITTTDNAGNSRDTKHDIIGDTVAPEVTVKYINNEARNDKYFKADRTIEITYVEDNFVVDDAENGVNVIAKDAEGNDITVSKKWDGKILTLEFKGEGYYEFFMEHQDPAGNIANVTKIGDTEEDGQPVAPVAPDAFVIDKSAPTGEAVVTFTFEPKENDNEGAEETTSEERYTELQTGLCYTLWANKCITVKADAQDAVSGIEPIEYFVDYFSGDQELKLLAAEQLDDLKVWNANPVSIDVDSRFIAYAKITDMAGNVHYISSNGLIVDTKAPISALEDETKVIVTHEKAGATELVDQLYGASGGDTVPVQIAITDPKYLGTEANEKGAFSGFQTITYTITTTGSGSDAGTLFSTDTAAELAEVEATNLETDEETGLVYAWSGTLNVNKATFNSNNVKVTVIAIDNAGNAAIGETTLVIDVTNPTITVEYDNNSSDGDYFKADRTATITVQERNFDSAKFNLKITNTDGTVPRISKWQTTVADGNGDGTTHKATVVFAVDGDYTVAMDCTDIAGNGNDPVTYVEGTVAAERFTIDKTAPVVSVSYDNNTADNEKYFDALRTGTVTVVEHNFDESRVQFTQTADRGGVAPAAQWSHNGDIHTATFAYTADGDYTFDVTMKDLAGNASAAADYGVSVAGKDFIIDTTYDEMIEVSGVESGKAYGYDADIVPEIKIADINLDIFDVKLTGIQRDQTIDLTEQVNALMQIAAQEANGTFDIFEVVQDMDGIYTLEVVARDKAGNEDTEEVIFTVNRFGSVYVYDSYLMSLIKDGGAFVQQVEGDLIITEYNADKLLADSLKIEITRDGKPLDEVKFSVTPEINDTVEVGESGWYQYKYTISKDNFATDGIYKISVASEDATGNTPVNTNYEDMSMSFRVDSTKAEISSIIGLEEDIINAQEVEVTYTVFDVIGLKNIKVYINGKLDQEITDFSADPNTYNGSFKLQESSDEQTVQIVVEDLAGNINDTAAKDFTSAYKFNDKVTVSTNFFVRWYADKALFWGSIGGIAVVLAAIVAFIVAKKKKAAAK